VRAPIPVVPTLGFKVERQKRSVIPSEAKNLLFSYFQEKAGSPILESVNRTSRKHRARNDSVVSSSLVADERINDPARTYPSQRCVELARRVYGCFALDEGSRIAARQNCVIAVALNGFDAEIPGDSVEIAKTLLQRSLWFLWNRWPELSDGGQILGRKCTRQAVHGGPDVRSGHEQRLRHHRVGPLNPGLLKDRGFPGIQSVAGGLVLRAGNGSHEQQRHGQNAPIRADAHVLMPSFRPQDHNDLT